MSVLDHPPVTQRPSLRLPARVDPDRPLAPRWWESIGAVVGASAVWMAIVTVAESARVGQTSWHFFDSAARLVFGRPRSSGGLHVYVSYPKFQFGPLSIVGAQVIRLGSFGHGPLLASVVMGALAPLILWILLDAARIVGYDDDGHRWTRAYAAAFCLPLVWGYLSVYSLHLDDALAITFMALALWGVAKRSDVAVGIGLGLAMASKPWAAAFLPLILALPSGRRGRAAGLAAICAGVFWLPFVLGDGGTVGALGHFRIGNVPESALRALGVHDRYTPSWDRAAQAALGAAAGTWCVRTGRWPAALMAAAAIRLAIDPGTHRYYAAGIVVFILAWELISSRWAVPLLSLTATTALIAPRYLGWSPAFSGDVRLGTCVLVLVCALVVRGPRSTGIASIDARRTAATAGTVHQLVAR